MLQGFALPGAPARAGHKRPRVDEEGGGAIAEALPQGAVLVTEVGEGLAAAPPAPRLVIPLAAREGAPAAGCAPPVFRAAKQVDEATMNALFAPGQSRVAAVEGRSAPLLQVVGGGGGGAAAPRGSGALGSSLGALSEAIAPQDERYSAVPVAEFGAAMLRGMGAVVDDNPLAESAAAQGGGEEGQRRHNRSRLGLGAAPNPLAPPPAPPHGRHPRGGAAGAAATALAAEQASAQAAVAAAATAAAARARREANPALKALPGAPHLYPSAIIRHAALGHLAYVTQVDGVPGLDRVRARRAGGVVEVYGIGECAPFFESGAEARERAAAAELRKEAAAAGAAGAGAPPQPPPPVEAAAAAAAGGRAYRAGAVVKVVAGALKGSKVLVVEQQQHGLIVRPVDKGEEARARVGLAEVETVIPKVGGGVVLIGAAHRGARGAVESIYTERFCIDVRLDSGEVLKGIEYEDVTKYGGPQK
jgi:hypothetical protein